ncbi:MAG: DNA-3-methyladenine glycosylase [Deltaproteobacteria bacterium]|nr:DNA-3-methyladenine glycosylase [Deltaproteobacteria bacterium]
MRKLKRDFYDRDATSVAKDLLGKYVVRRDNGIERVGKIVEVEAYLGPHDLAAHSARGRTARNEVMFGPSGHAYVYMIYGMHFCMNVVTEKEGHASAVLLRALEPVCNLTGKTSGPGLLCKALGIDRRLNGHDLQSDDFFIAAPETVCRNGGASASDGEFKIVARPRIGVDYAGAWARKPLRFYIRGNPFVSRK